MLTVYQGGTLTLANCFQDIGLAIPAQNPMTADETSRLPLFYVADGTYSIRLVDKTGVQVFYYPQVPSIGASSSGGGGSAVDPTTIFQTGDPIWLPIAGTRAGFVRMNGRTIGSATSGSSERANADCQPLFLYIWANFTDALCPVSGGRGVSAAADWAANKTIGMLDMRGRGPFGLDGMGNAAAGILTTANLGVNSDTASLAFGEEKHILVQPELPSATLNTAIAAGQGSHPHNLVATSGNNLAGPAGLSFTANPAGTVIPVAAATLPAMTGSTPLGGADTAHQNMTPGRLGSWYQRL